LLKKAGVLKNGEKWGKTGKKRAKNGDCPHFIQKCGFDGSNPYAKTGRLEEGKYFYF
jgi:hypothetical protein